MVNCCVIGCKSRADRKQGVSFHRFPKDKKKKKIWLEAINRSDWTPPIDARVCSLHFDTSCVIPKARSSLLDDNAYPIKLHSNEVFLTMDQPESSMVKTSYSSMDKAQLQEKVLKLKRKLEKVQSSYKNLKEISRNRLRIIQNLRNARSRAEKKIRVLSDTVSKLLVSEKDKWEFEIVG